MNNVGINLTAMKNNSGFSKVSIFVVIRLVVN